WPMPATDKIATIEKSDVKYATMFLPKHSSYFASYFTITGLHGAHVLGGVLVFCYMMLPASTRIYRHNPEHLANRVEVAGLFWHAYLAWYDPLQRSCRLKVFLLFLSSAPPCSRSVSAAIAFGSI